MLTRWTSVLIKQLQDQLRKLSVFRNKKKSDDLDRSSSASPVNAIPRSIGDRVISSTDNATLIGSEGSILSRYNTDVSFRPHLHESSSGSQDIIDTRRGSEVEAIHGKLGLSVLHEPEDGKRHADIVFVHGLGGASRKTWRKDLKPELFWPQTFLPLESDLGQTRTLTFGYNADFRKAGAVHVSVLDFAKDLLWELKNARTDRGDPLEIGEVSVFNC